MRDVDCFESELDAEKKGRKCRFAMETALDGNAPAMLLRRCIKKKVGHGVMKS
jgi:hypothetical protein